MPIVPVVSPIHQIERGWHAGYERAETRTEPALPLRQRAEIQDNTIRALGIDSLTNYQWCHYVHPQGGYGAWAEQAIAYREGWAREFSARFFPHVSVG